MAVCNVNMLPKCLLCAGFVARLHLNVSVHNLLSNIIWIKYHKKRQSKTHLRMTVYLKDTLRQHDVNHLFPSCGFCE